MTRPENAEQTESQRGLNDPDLAEEVTRQGSSGSDVASSTPHQRQRTTPGGGDPKTVTLQVDAPAHARSGIGEQADRQPADGRGYGSGLSAGSGAPQHGDPGSGPDFAPTTVRIGGYTAPERVLPAAVQGAAASGVTGSSVAGSGAQSRSVRVPRRTSLQLQRLDPWSVLKLSLVLSVAGFLVWLVAVGVLYGVLAGMGVWDQINGTYSDLTSGSNPQVNTELISGGRVFGVAFVVGLVNIVLLTALATVGSLMYNVAADFVGGIEVTLSEPD